MEQQINSPAREIAILPHSSGNYFGSLSGKFTESSHFRHTRVTNGF